MEQNALRKEFPGYKLRISSIEEAEKESMARMVEAGPRVPQVPFGFGQAHWDAFKAKMLPGDRLVFFDSPEEDWMCLCGEKGYAIVRPDPSGWPMVVARYCTCMS